MIVDNLKYFFLTAVVLTSVAAQSTIDCRVITGDTTACNPYGKRLHHIKEVMYNVDRKKLIIVKNLPKPKQKHLLKVISVKDMMNKYFKVEPPVRFKGVALTPKRAKKPIIIRQISKDHVKKESPQRYGFYTVRKGDSLSRIADKLTLTIKDIIALNKVETSATLRIGQKLKVPYVQPIVDARIRGQYTVEKADTLLSIAEKFKLSPKDIVVFNQIKDASSVHEGKVLKLPLPYILDKLQLKEKDDSSALGHSFDINAFGHHSLRVTATAYTSHGNQTDDTPFLAAWNNHLRPGVKSIAVSRDLLTRYGMRNGTKVRIGGLRGFYRVRDKMNKRYKKRIDIYMGLDLRRALKWGRRSVVIYW